MAKTKIEWCDQVWNPVWGCERGCRYCYARGIARRFGKTEAQRAFTPTWVEDNFKRTFPKSTKRVFVNSMSDPQFWCRHWWLTILDRIAQMPDIDFIFLTKGGYGVYDEYLNVMPSNCIIGLTATTRAELFKLERQQPITSHRYLLNIEPIQEDLGWHIDHIVENFQWVIIGAETGTNPRNRVIPESYWFEAVYNICRSYHIPLFIKPSLDGIAIEISREYPERRTS